MLWVWVESEIDELVGAYLAARTRATEECRRSSSRPSLGSFPPSSFDQRTSRAASSEDVSEHLKEYADEAYSAKEEQLGRPS